MLENDDSIMRNKHLKRIKKLWCQGNSTSSHWCFSRYCCSLSLMFGTSKLWSLSLDGVRLKGIECWVWGPNCSIYSQSFHQAFVSIFGLSWEVHWTFQSSYDIIYEVHLTFQNIYDIYDIKFIRKFFEHSKTFMIPSS